jgi:hypothetical protein
LVIDKPEIGHNRASGKLGRVMGLMEKKKRRFAIMTCAERALSSLCFLSILSIKCRNWFYWAERAERAESKEWPVFMRIWAYVAGNQ